MNLLLSPFSQLTPLPLAVDPEEITAVLPAADAGATPAVRHDDLQAQPAFNDALLNVIHSLSGGEPPRDTAMVLAEVKSDDDDDRTSRDPMAAAQVQQLLASPQQLLDTLLTASQMPVKTLNAMPRSAPLAGEALKIQTLNAGQPATLNAATAGLTPPPVMPHGTPVPVERAMKPAAADLLKTLEILQPAQGLPGAGQTTLSATDKQTVNLPPVRLEGDEAKWAQQLHSALNDRLQLQVRNQVQHATIRLDPPEMGKVDISLQIENGRMQVHINASNGETYRALAQISNELRQSLTEQHFVQVNVQVSSQSGQQQQQGRGEYVPASQDNPAAGAVIAAEETTPTVDKDDSVLLTV